MIVGTAGHIDHGKTALVRALTGVETDRLKEEKERGISIDLGFAYLPAPDGSVLGFVDVPGHERFVRTMVAGATGIDFVLLVVAADDGVMPQTIEHLAIVDLLGIARGVVALTKTDLVSDERRAEAADEIAALLAGTALDGSEILPVSSATGEGIDALRERLFAAARETQTRALSGRFRFAIDRSFALTGAGTVVTGTVVSGAVAVGDSVTISPSGLAARVRAIHAQNRPAERGVAGERCGLNLAGERIAKDAIRRGDMALDPTLHAPTSRIDASLRVLASEAKPIRQWLPVRLHHASANVGGRIVLLDDTAIAPGGTGLVQLVLEEPIAAAEGDAFVVRDPAGQRTIGGGRFLDLRAPARRRRTPERRVLLAARGLADPERALAQLLDLAPFFADLDAFARDRSLGLGTIDEIAKQLGLVRFGPLALSAATHEKLKRGILAALAAFHRDHPNLQGVTLDTLRRAVELVLPAPLFQSLMQALARERIVALDGARARLPTHASQLGARAAALWTRIEPRLAGEARFRPPRIADLAPLLKASEAELRGVLKSLAKAGVVGEVAPDHFFLRETIAEMAEVAAELAARGSGAFGAAEFRDRLDNGRKVAIQILEYFDRHGLTSRRGDVRRVNELRLAELRVRDNAGGPA